MVAVRRSWFNRICGTMIVLAALIVASGSITAYAGDDISNNVNVNTIYVPIAPDVGAGGVVENIDFVAWDDGAGGVVLVAVSCFAQMDMDGAYCENSGQGPVGNTRIWTAGASPTNHLGKTPMASVNQFCYTFREPQSVCVATIPVNAAAVGYIGTKSGTLVLRC